MAAAGIQHFSDSPYWPTRVVNPDGSKPEVKWDEAFECFSVNGVLAPSPLSYLLPVDAQSSDDDERTPEPMERQRAPGPPSKVNQPTGSSKSSRKRSRQSDQDHHHPMLFRLHKFINRVEEYFLQVHEPITSTTHFHKVEMYKDNKGKWLMRVVTCTEPKNNEVEAWLEDPTHPFFEKRSDLDFQQRLSGWTLESRARNNGREDKFYYHQGKQYKSFVQVMTFVLYANKHLKDLRRRVELGPNNYALVPFLVS